MEDVFSEHLEEKQRLLVSSANQKLVQSTFPLITIIPEREMVFRNKEKVTSTHLDTHKIFSKLFSESASI